jgi:hypothetical protein
MNGRGRRALLVLLLAFGAATFASPNGWERFRSSDHFSVLYPATWFRIGGSTDRLELLSSKGGAEGIIIKRGQALITVMEAQESVAKTLPQVIDYYEKGTSVLSKKNLSGEVGKGGCSDLMEIISQEPAVPPEDVPISVPYIMNTSFFCEIGERKIVVLLRNWKGDTRQENYQQIALRMAKSIHKRQG